LLRQNKQNRLFVKMVEAAALGLDNSVLLDNLSYKLGNGAAYVQERKSSTFYATGNLYSTKGVKVIKILLSGDGYLDPQTFRVMFDVNNKDTNTARLLRPLGDGHSFFSRMRLLMGSTVVEDIQDYGRLAFMFGLLVNKNSKVNMAAEGFGLPPYSFSSTAVAEFPGIPPNSSHTILFTPLSGIFAQTKYIPLRYAPITLELELCSDALDPIVSADGLFDLNTSESWELSEVQGKCDILTLDSDLENGYTQLLMSGKHLTLNYSTYIHQYQALVAQKTRLSVGRSLSRLKSVFVTFDKATSNGAIYKKINSFISPLYGAENVGTDIIGMPAKEMEFSIHLGSKQFPERAIASHQEAYYQLRKTMGVQSSALHSFDISGQEYKRRSFILGIDTETILHAAFTGYNTRDGTLLNIQFDLKSSEPADRPNDMYIVLHSDNLVEISDSGVRCYD
jgi:hypothetical protein